jgi:dihydroorotase
MQTRREFLVGMTALSAAHRGRALRAATYDVLVKGGRVVDPAASIDRVMDVAIAGGRIARVAPDISTNEATEVIDARGKIVTPGLVDIHAHLDAEMPPSHCLSTGVTAIVDAGSRGADNVGDLVTMAKRAPNRMRILLNLGRTGLGSTPELLDFANADVAAARRAVDANGDVIIGVKARLSQSVAAARDLDAIDRAHEVTVPLGLPLMVHIGQTVSPVPALLSRLRPGDIVTHVYAPPPNTIFNESGRIFPEVLEARKRGILFDIGNGRNGHITWEMADRALQQRFLPDTISSDLTAPGRTDRVFDFPTVLSKFLLLGLPLDQVIARATINAARAIAPFRDLGTLAVGAPADVSVFELQTGEFEFVDNERTKRVGRQKLVPSTVIVGGRQVRQVGAGQQIVQPANGVGSILPALPALPAPTKRSFDRPPTARRWPAPLHREAAGRPSSGRDGARGG